MQKFPVRSAGKGDEEIQESRAVAGNHSQAILIPKKT